jgi:hypothetical protein
MGLTLSATAQDRDNKTELAQNRDTKSKETATGTRSVNFGLVYPITTNGFNAPKCSNYFSLTAIAGVSRAETGASIAGLANIVLDKSSGVQLAGLWNMTRNHSAGVQIGGLANMAGDAHVQIAGFINIAKRVKGVQLAGFLNIADSSDCPIGLINLIRNGEKSAGLSVDETRTVLSSFRSGGRKLYGIVGIGYNGHMHALHSTQTSNEALNLASGEAGIGAHWNISETFRVNTELAATICTDFEHGDYQKYVFRLLPSLHFQHFEIYAGPTFNYACSEKGLGSDLIGHYTWSQNAGTTNFEALFFGAIAGINYRF